MSNINDLTIQDLEILSQLPKMTSIRSFAQNLDITPSFLSKKIKRLENTIGITLIKRSTQGISITEEATEAIKTAREIVEKISKITNTRPVQKEDLKVINIGTRGFLNSALIPLILNHFQNKNIKRRFQFIDMSPDDQMNAAKKNEVDILITLKKTNFGDSWLTNSLKPIKWNVYAGRNHPLAKKKNISLEKALVYPFTKPSFWDGNSIMTINDSLPIKRKNLTFGHSIQNTQSAISIITNTNQLTYMPDIAALRSLELGEIVKLSIFDIDTKEDQLFISVHSDRVSNIVYNEFVKAIELSNI